MEDYLMTLLHLCAGAIIGVKIGWYCTERMNNAYLKACAQDGTPAAIDGMMYVVLPEQKFRDLRNLAKETIGLLQKSCERVALLNRAETHAPTPPTTPIPLQKESE